MNSLFEIESTCDPHISSIINNIMLKKLKNNHPKQDSKVYLRNVSYIKELYDGTFLHHTFNCDRKDYNYSGCFEKIKQCKGSWINIKNLIITVIDNIELSKDKQYLPFNKSFVNSITFATFFEYFDINSDHTGISSNFINFINEPKRCYEYTSNITINKLKDNCLSNIKEYGEKIAKKYFKDKSAELSFWYNMEDLCRWLKSFRNAFPHEYNEFILICKNGNPLEDYEEYLLNSLSYKQGENVIVQPIYFQLSKLGSNKLEGNFLYWLKNGIEKNKFSILKNLPKSINSYYKDNSFEKTKSKSKKTVEKEIIDLDDVVF